MTYPPPVGLVSCLCAWFCAQWCGVCGLVRRDARLFCQAAKGPGVGCVSVVLMSLSVACDRVPRFGVFACLWVGLVEVWGAFDALCALCGVCAVIRACLRLLCWLCVVFGTMCGCVGVVCEMKRGVGGWSKGNQGTRVCSLSFVLPPTPFCGVVAAVSYSPTPCRVQYHRRCWA